MWVRSAFVYVQCFPQLLISTLPCFDGWFLKAALTDKKDDATVTPPLVHGVNPVCVRREADPEVFDLSRIVGHQRPVTFSPPEMCTCFSREGTQHNSLYWCFLTILYGLLACQWIPQKEKSTLDLFGLLQISFAKFLWCHREHLLPHSHLPRLTATPRLARFRLGLFSFFFVSFKICERFIRS